MKRIILVLSLILTGFMFSNCNSEKEAESEWEVFGKEISAVEYVSISDVIDEFELDVEKEFKISGELSSVCQKKGCWTILETEDKRNVRMTFENYGFFLPVDYAGKQVIAEGKGLKKVTSVNELRHYAEDAGKSEEEILAITEPKTEYLFEASGVLVK